MKSFNIPEYYRSPIISRVKNIRSAADKRKKDFSPSVLNFGKVEFVLARHFGFCFGVENAIEISYRAIEENPNKRIFLLSQMIHNPGVNDDLEAHGIRFIQDTLGNQLIDWNELSAEDIVIIPAFGTTVEIEERLKNIGIELQQYDTTCPFVTRVWKKSEKLGTDDHTVIIHGKDKHEETRATFSHSRQHAKSVVIRDISEAKMLGEVILGEKNKADFEHIFGGRYSENFDSDRDLDKIGVVNQTTMLASETQEISDYLHQIMLQKFGQEKVSNHFANTRDTLCYATNDNQTATSNLLNEQADLAIVVGGYNSSNTSHLVELLEQNFSTYFIKNEDELLSTNTIRHFNLHQKEVLESENYLPQKEQIRIILTSGASCPDATVDRIIQKILSFTGADVDLDEVMNNLQKKFGDGV
ncbi:MAG: 4-hydroxy-3-methylbut-2-enyl diphosphate reductase [Flavobacteriales bacterium]|nr:4-hydroxy-3-methylbut-2-enyl diphosphate reductase [Flavobacteriales bacterium]